MISTKEIIFGDKKILLNNQRSLFFQDEQALVLSDLHLGKSAHFRKNGIPIPDGIAEKDLEKLKSQILHFKAKSVIIVGDLFHAGMNSELDFFKHWLTQFPATIFHLVNGNHDKLSKKKRNDFMLEFHDELKLGEIKLVHEPKNLDEHSISGHIHPGISLKAPNKARVNLPCFLVSENQIILPAFSEFTGLDTQFLKNQNTDYRKYLITKTALMEF